MNVCGDGFVTEDLEGRDGFENARIGEQIVSYPFPVGHECSAVVEKTGSAVTRVRPGDRVAVDPLIHCGRCDQCLAGSIHTCRDQVFLGCPGQAPGSLCERIVMPEEDETVRSEPLEEPSIEEIDTGPVEAITATGANRLQTLAYAIIPQVIPKFLAFILYQWDINIRMSTVIGFVGGGGIGQQFRLWVGLNQYSSAGMATWAIVAMVWSMDTISARARERLV